MNTINTPGSAPKKNDPDIRNILIAWVIVCLCMSALASRNLTTLGLYYDEAVFAGLAKDFLSGTTRPHMPGTQTFDVFGHPFPVFVQDYLGAVKSWLIIPGFLIFGQSVAVLRATSTAYYAIVLLLFMLWANRLMGYKAACVAAPLLAFDPSLFFISIYDWGSIIPSLLCRMGGMYLFVVWWQRRKAWYFFFAGVLFGIGIFNKVDFIVIIAGAGAAAVMAYWEEFKALVRAERFKLLLGISGLILGMVLMSFKMFPILKRILGSTAAGRSNEWLEKLNAAKAMYDSSYFYRLMDAGGMFANMYTLRNAVWSPFGLLVALGAVLLVIRLVHGYAADTSEKKIHTFILLGLLFTSLGAFLIPRAARIHHTTLVYPFPHLIIVAAFFELWKWQGNTFNRRFYRAMAAGFVVCVLIAQFIVILKTQSLIERTGGRGMWSNTFTDYCRSIKGRSELSVVSFDWGFNEQLSFLSDKVNIYETIWDAPEHRRKISSFPANTIILLHPPEYTLFGNETFILNDALQYDQRSVSIKAYRDREQHIAFYSITLNNHGQN